MKFDFNAKIFYSVGKYVFFLSGCVGIMFLIDNWTTAKAYDIVGKFGMVLFNFALWQFFGYLQKKESIVELTDEQTEKMSKVLDELNFTGGQDGKKN